MVFKFWEDLYSSSDGRRLFSEHPQLIGKTPLDLQYTAPFVIFEDAGPISKGQSAAVVCYSAILGMGSEIDQKLVAATFLKVTGDEGKTPTDDAAWAAFFKSWEALEAGYGPVGDFGEKSIQAELAGKSLLVFAEQLWKSITLFGKSDGEQRTVVWGCPSTNSEEPCTWCKADRSGRPYTDLSEFAKWRGQVFTRETFLARLSQPRHPLADAPFTSQFFFIADLMQVADSHLLRCQGGSARLPTG